MSDRYDKCRWLELAFSQQVDTLNESYYFDKQDNEFFSVFITDYFLIDPSSTDNYSDHPYSPGELKILTDRINRLALSDTNILSIPSLTVDDRIQMMQSFLSIRPCVNNYDDLQKTVESENGRTNSDFDHLLHNDDDQEQWRQFKSDFIKQKIDTFCKLQNINIDTASLWTDKKMTTIGLSVDDEMEELTSKHNNPWCKWW